MADEGLIYRDPVHLHHGKTGAALLACASNFLQGVWCFGSRDGILILSQIHDRGRPLSLRQGVSGIFANRWSKMHGLDSKEGSSTDHAISLSCRMCVA
eukprot:2673363-Amphidinium_carterae.3